MVQAAFEFTPLGKVFNAMAAPLTPGAPPLRPAAPMDAVGFEIGWDHAHHRITPPLCHLHAPNPVHQGWCAGRAAFGKRSLAASAAVRQWLGLRLEAWQHGQDFEGVQVTPHFLARIDAVQCPVSRQTLTLSAGRDSDATITRLNRRAAYAAGNLVVLSQRVADAHHAADHAADHAASAIATDSTQVSGSAPALSADEQARLAVLASFTTPLPHGRAALLALRVLPPNRVRVINPVQALQVMLTLQFLHAGYARRLLGLAVLMPGSEVRHAFQIFMHTLLARRLSAGQDASPAALRQALEDSWADALVNRRWQRLATRLSAADCETLLQRASQRGWVVGGSRWVSADAATEGWSLHGGLTVSLNRTQHNAQTDARTDAQTDLQNNVQNDMQNVMLNDAQHAAPGVAAGPGAQAEASSAVTSPGMARSLASQKLAN